MRIKLFESGSGIMMRIRWIRIRTTGKRWHTLYIFSLTARQKGIPWLWVVRTGLPRVAFQHWKLLRTPGSCINTGVPGCGSPPVQYSTVALYNPAANKFSAVVTSIPRISPAPRGGYWIKNLPISEGPSMLTVTCIDHLGQWGTDGKKMPEHTLPKRRNPFFRDITWNVAGKTWYYA